MKAQISDRRYGMPRLLVRPLRYGAVAALLTLLALLSVGMAAAADPTLAIESVTFNKGLDVVDDKINGPDPFVLVAKPQWVAGDDKGNAARPVAYVSGTKVTVTVVFAVTNPPSNNTTVFVTGSNDTVGAYTTQDLLIKGQPKLTITNFTFPNYLAPSETQFFNNTFQIAWTYKLKNAGPPSSAGTSTHILYVTLKAAKPAGTKIYKTSLKLSIPKGGDTTEAMVFNTTWCSFSTGIPPGCGQGPADVRNWNGDKLYYYKEGLGFAGTCPVDGEVDALLRHAEGNARCGVWAKFFQNTLAINGITSTRTAATAINSWLIMVNNWSKLGVGKEDPKNCDMTSPCKGSTFQVTAGSYINEMVPAPGADKKDYCNFHNDPGLKGQNSATAPSEKVFPDHAFVKYDNGECVSSDCYYNPSYGVTYRNEKNFQAKAVYSFLHKKPGGLEATQLCQEGKADNIMFTPLP